MAQFHKGKNHLSGKANRNLVAGAFCLALVMACFYIIFTQKMQVDRWFYFLPITTFLVLGGYYIRRGVIFRFGAKGENVGLINALNLPEGYHVFSNVTVSYQNHQQEADLIIVGTKGVYVVEVKNHNGKIVGDGNLPQWTQHKVGRGGGRYSKQMGNPVKQVKGQVYKLSKLFKEHGINVWVDGVVLFTNESVHVAVQNCNVPVLYPAKRLSHYILTCNNRQYLNRTLINKVVEILSKMQ